MVIGTEITLEILFLVGKICSVVYLAVSVIAWTGNGLIVIATIRSKKLRTPCNILIAIEAATDIIVQISHLFLALDRLLSVTFTLFYERLKTFCYIGFICLVSFTYAISFRVFSYVTFIDAPVLCMIADGTSGSALTSWMICSIAINLGVIGIYVALNFKLSGHAASQQSVTQVTRSLQTLILVYIFGWLFTFVGTTFGMLTIKDPLLFSALMIVLGIQANLNLAAPFFVYFFRSSLYKMEIKKLFERKTVFVASSLSKRSTSFVSTQ